MSTKSFVSAPIDTYQTIFSDGQSLFKDRGSKFLGYAEMHNTVEAAKNRIQELRDLHPKACHVCFAWRIGFNPLEERFSDDGEPNNSAGKPIFGQLIKHDLQNVLVAVVRYYGGTNLGVGGLITAYKTAAAEAIESAELGIQEIELQFQLRFDQTSTGNAMNLLNKTEATIQEHGFDENGPFIRGTIKKSKSEVIENEVHQHHLISLKLWN